MEFLLAWCREFYESDTEGKILVGIITIGTLFFACLLIALVIASAPLSFFIIGAIVLIFYVMLKIGKFASDQDNTEED